MLSLIGPFALVHCSVYSSPQLSAEGHPLWCHLEPAGARGRASAPRSRGAMCVCEQALAARLTPQPGSCGAQSRGERHGGSGWPRAGLDCWSVTFVRLYDVWSNRLCSSNTVSARKPTRMTAAVFMQSCCKDHTVLARLSAPRRSKPWPVALAVYFAADEREAGEIT